MARPDVDIVIGSKDGKSLLVRCLESVYEQRYDGPIHIAVVDSHSHDQSPFVITSRYPQTQLFEMPGDVGQAGAYNLAYSKTQSPYVLFLSQDVELEPDFIEQQVRFLEGNPHLAGAAAKIRLGHDSGAVRRIDSLGLSLKGPLIVLANHASAEDDRDETPHDVFGPAGAAAVWRRDALARLRVAADGALFDEDLHTGHLDADLAWRAQWLGLRFQVNPLAAALHQRGQLYAKDALRRANLDALRIRNRLLVYRKNLLFDGWAQYGGIVRKSARRDWMEHLRRRGVMSGVDAWLAAKTAMPKMRRKAAVLEKTASALPERVFKMIFFHRSFGERDGGQ